jgi:hypothetical protein
MASRWRIQRSSARDELVAFQITAHAHQGTCRWRIELDLLVDGREETLELPRDEVYETTCANAGDTPYEWAWHMRPLLLAPQEEIQRSIRAGAYPAHRLTLEERVRRLLRISAWR